MTNRNAIIIALLLILLGLADYAFDWGLFLSIGRKLIELLHILAIWR